MEVKLGPIDWSYDFQADDWDHRGCTNPTVIAEAKALLRRCEESVGAATATTDGGWPRIGYALVLDAGMVSSPAAPSGMPSVLLRGLLTGRGYWYPYYMIRDVKEATR